MKLGVVGYSTRALVQAVVELGHSAIAIDAFGDQDTLDAAEQVQVVEDWPGGIWHAARQVAVDGWLLAGGMENCEEIVWGRVGDSSKALCNLAPVLGPTLEHIRTLRSLRFCEQLCVEGMHWSTTRTTAPDDNADWLLKPMRSAGGLSIRQWTGMYRNEAHDNSFKSHCWQRRIEGRVLGITWMLGPFGCHLSGITQSLTEQDWPGPSEFIYRGSIGPITLDDDQVDVLAGLGERVQAALPSYLGYLQADMIEDAEGRLWLLEFNPRCTAGMEVLHEAAQLHTQSPISQHLQTWGVDTSGAAWNRPSISLVAKAIYYAERGIELTQATRRRLGELRNWQEAACATAQWCVADVPPVAPAAPMRFLAGSPILTVKSRQLGKSIWEV